MVYYGDMNRIDIKNECFKKLNKFSFTIDVDINRFVLGFGTISYNLYFDGYIKKKIYYFYGDRMHSSICGIRNIVGRYLFRNEEMAYMTANRHKIRK